MKIYHLVTPETWRRALADDHYAPASLTEEGFVHMSFAEQVETTANRHYARAGSLWAVEFSGAVFGSDLVVEDTSGHGDFPHVYRAIDPCDADRVLELLRTDEGWRLDL